MASVGGRASRDWVAVERALHVGDRIRVGAGIGRLPARVTLVVDVKAKAELLAIAEFGAARNIVFATVDGLVGQISNLLSASLKVDKALLIAVWGLSILCVVGENAVGEIVADRTSLRNRSLAVSSLGQKDATNEDLNLPSRLKSTS